MASLLNRTTERRERVCGRYRPGRARRWQVLGFRSARLLAVVCAALVVCSTAPGEASAVELVNPDGTRAEPFQTWADTIPIATPATRVVGHSEPCPLIATAACTTFQDGQPPHLYVDPRGEAVVGPNASVVARSAQALFAHEVGHIFYLGLPSGMVNRFVRLTSRASWYGDMPADERFAEAFRFCSFSSYRRLVRRGVSGPYGPPLRQHVKTCKLIYRMSAIY